MTELHICFTDLGRAAAIMAQGKDGVYMLIDEEHNLNEYEYKEMIRKAERRAKHKAPPGICIGSVYVEGKWQVLMSVAPK